MRAGNLDRVIEIHAPTVTVDEAGTPITSYVKLVTLRVQTLKHSIDDREGQHAVTDTTMSFRCYWFPGVWPGHRVVFEGNAYNVTAIRELGRRAGMDLIVEKVGR